MFLPRPLAGWLLFSLILRVNSIWTEDDEAERIAMIMADEKKMFEQEMRNQQYAKPRADSRSAFQTAREKLGMGPSSSKGNKQEKIEEQVPLASRSSQSESSDDNWCYHCTSPLSHLSGAMKRTIKEFLKVRRTTYPEEVVTPECVSAKNFTRLAKQYCKHRYCQTFSLVDNDEGASFVLRGCAENFGAINTKQLEAQPENTCTRLHDKVDIKECICKERKYCYANGKMTSSTKGTTWIAYLMGLILVVI